MAHQVYSDGRFPFWITRTLEAAKRAVDNQKEKHPEREYFIDNVVIEDLNSELRLASNYVVVSNPMQEFFAEVSLLIHDFHSINLEDVDGDYYGQYMLRLEKIAYMLSFMLGDNGIEEAALSYARKLKR